MSADISEAVRGFIVESFLFGVAADAPMRDDSFLALGYIDSTAMLELISFVEETFDIEIADDELVPANLDSVGKITDLVVRKKGGDNGL